MGIVIKAVVIIAAVFALGMFLRDVYHYIIGDEENNG